jgi:ElaB/YqjD/DUF883 family membrane-anchored ribosome-binding protein
MEHRDRGRTGSEQPWSDWAKSEARDLGEAAPHLDEVKREAKDYVAGARDYVQGAVEQTREFVTDAVHGAGDRMAEYREGGMPKVREDLVRYTKEQPVTALLIAAGAGLILGWLTAVGRR